MEIDLSKFEWTREPESCAIYDGVIEIVTKPHTDLWQRTSGISDGDRGKVFQLYRKDRFPGKPSQV